MVIPAIVTHPCTLFRDGLRQILVGTRFKPVHVAPALNEAAIRHLSSAETSLWLLGLERCNECTFDLVRRVCAGTSGLKAVILAQCQTAEDVSSAIAAGASGFLGQDISCERLVKSLELIALGEIVVPATYLRAIGARVSTPAQLRSHPGHGERVPSVQAASQAASREGTLDRRRAHQRDCRSGRHLFCGCSRMALQSKVSSHVNWGSPSQL
jgi:DNA-binding NarL/FixJ family response regulator